MNDNLRIALALCFTLAMPILNATNLGGEALEERILACSPVARYADATVKQQKFEEINANVVPLAARKFCTHVDVLHSDGIFEKYRNEALALQASSGKPAYTAGELYYFLSCKGSMAGWSPIDYSWARPVEDGKGNIHPNTFRMLETAGEFLALPGRNGLTLLQQVENTMASYRKQAGQDQKLAMFTEYRDQLRAILERVEVRACNSSEEAGLQQPTGG